MQSTQCRIICPAEAALQDAACRNGFKTMEGKVLASNRKMLKFARQLGFKIYREPREVDTLRISLQLRCCPDA